MPNRPTANPGLAAPLLATGLGLAASLLALASPAPAFAQAPGERLPCLIEARMKVKVSASVPGVVASVLVDRGDKVQAGQTLVELESSVERAALAMANARAANMEPILSARAKVAAAQRNFERFERLRKSNPGAVTDVKFDETQMEARVAEANLRDAERNREFAELEAQRAQSLLALRTVRSPVNGVVIERAMAPGEFRNEQAHFLTIAAIDPLYVEVFLPVAWYPRVKIGMSAEVLPAAPIGGAHAARVSVVDPVIDAPSGTFGIRLEMPNPEGRIPAGLRCEVRFAAPA